MSAPTKPLARTRRAVRRVLAAVLPERIVDGARARYLGSWWLARAGDSGEPDLVVARALLPGGASAVDGGANFGRYSDAFARAVGPAGRVVAVEPVPHTAALLRRVMRLRGHDNVVVVQAALAAAPGVGRMEVPTDAVGDTNFFRAHLTDGNEGGTVIEVSLDTLDAVVGRFLSGEPALIKLDLEGHEREALTAASTLLAGRAAWLIEMNDDPDVPGTDAAAVEAMFTSRGYTPWTFDGPSASLSRRGPGPRGPNVFFLLPHHVERVRAAGLRVDAVVGA